jgi:hypothetical protein
MGTLATIGVVSDGKITQIAATRYRDNVVKTLKEGISLGSINLPPDSIDMGDFKTDSIGVIQEDYPAWHGVYVNGYIQNIGVLVDSIPDVGILKTVPIFDPTKPVAIIITELQETLSSIESSIGVPVVDVLISQIDVVIKNAADISSAIDVGNTTEFFNSLSNTIAEAFRSAGINPDPVVQKLEERKSEIENLATQIIEAAAEAVSGVVPDLPIPVLDTSFIDPRLDISPLFATIESNGIDGIGTKFIKAMTVFLSIPSEIIEAVSSAISGAAQAASEAIQKISSAIGKLLTNVQEAVSDLFSSITDFVWSLLSPVIGIASTAFLEISSFLNVIFFFAKCFIVSLIGFLLGSGLISLAAAKILEII